jgi:hypothetical protein
MAMKYQKGTVYPRGQKVKMWYGKYTVYLRNEEGKEVGKRRNIPLCPKAGTPKWKAEQMLHALILNETGVPAKIPLEFLTTRQRSAGSLRNGTFRCGKGLESSVSEINTYEIKHYLVGHFRQDSIGPTRHFRDPGLAEQSGRPNIRSRLFVTAIPTFVRSRTWPRS